MDRFDFSLNNNFVRAWLLIFLPVIGLAAVLCFFIPREYYFVPHLIQISAVSCFFVAYLVAKKKK
jgi:hypothetical protein